MASDPPNKPSDDIWKALRPTETEAPNDIQEQSEETANEFRRVQHVLDACVYLGF